MLTVLVPRCMSGIALKGRAPQSRRAFWQRSKCCLWGGGSWRHKFVRYFKEVEATFDWGERKRLGIAQDQRLLTRVPRRGAGIAAVNQLDRSDHVASQHIVPVRHRQAALRAVQQCLGEVFAGHAFGSMNQKAAGKIGVPTSVFYIFAAMDN